MKKRFWGLLLVFSMLCSLSACGNKPSSPGADTEGVLNVDVAVVGAGGAGMAAGIAAARAGKRVIILEKTDATGGSTACATSGMNAAKTEWQDENGWLEAAGLRRTLANAREAYPELSSLAKSVQKEYDDWVSAGSTGYFDCPGLFILDTMIGGKCVNDLDLVSTLAGNSAAAIEWLDGMGITLHAVVAFDGSSVRRNHRAVNAEGKVVDLGGYLAPLLEQSCIDNGVDILFNTPVTEVLMEDGRAVGVKAGEFTVNAGAVILATGGFGGDGEMVAGARPELEGFPSASAPGCTGDGLKMAQAVGAATVDLEHIQIQATMEQNTSALISESLLRNGAILVNAEGLRFCDETDDQETVAAAELAQTGGYAWLVVDQRMAENYADVEDYISKGYALQGTTPAALAEVLQVPVDSFTETLNGWNDFVAGGSDPDFGRTSFRTPLDAAPYYAIKVTPCVLHTMGGVRITPSAQVIDTSGRLIPGLFAAGEVTGGIHGADCLGGNAVADAVIFGKIAGESAAAYVYTEE